MPSGQIEVQAHLTESLFIPLAALLLVTAIVVASANVIYAGPSSQTPPPITLKIVDVTDATSSNVEDFPRKRVTMAVIASPVNDMAGIQFRLEFKPEVVTVPTDGVELIDLPTEAPNMCPPIPNTDNEFACGSAFKVDNIEGFVMIALAGAQAAGVDEMTIANITFDLDVLGGQNTPVIFQLDDQGDPATDYLIAADDNIVADPTTNVWTSGPGEITVIPSDGLITITPYERGDCDFDGENVGELDLSALVQEIFDGDGSSPIGAIGGTHDGDPIGCDADGDGDIGVHDISCVVLIIFTGNCDVEGSSARNLDRPSEGDSAAPSYSSGFAVLDSQRALIHPQQAGV